MTPETVVTIGRQGLELMLIVSAPLLLVSLVVGIAVSFFQAVTQINEQTLSFIPKIIVIVAALVIFAPWMTETLTTYTRDLFLNIPNVLAER
jgi:flagellar biosynthetic protein FliQ